ncbi:MAG: hypothetical protein AB7P33_11365 [Dehalococcoidia bacterium]
MNEPQVPSSPSKRSHTGLLVLGTVLGIVVLLIGITAVAIYFGSPGQDGEEVQALLESFVTRAAYGDADGVYSMFSRELKTKVSLDMVRRDVVPSMAAFRDFQMLEQTDWSRTLKLLGPPRVQYAGILTGRQGEQLQIAADLGKEDGEWKIIVIEANRCSSGKCPTSTLFSGFP